MSRVKALTQELREWRDTILAKAKAAGLDFPEVIFEVVDSNEVNELAALGGFPQRYPHWRFGMEYDRLAKNYSYGLGKIYEMVINTDPCYAYLLTSNSLLEQKLVMAHVYGHADFFKNNLYFAHTNRRMLDEMANHAVKIRGHHERFGVDVVEEFIDRCLSIDNLVDSHAAMMGQKSESEKARIAAEEGEDPSMQVQKMSAKSYMDQFVNPKEYLDSQREKIVERQMASERFPPRPEKDVLAFLLKHAPLKGWQQDCLEIIRDESLYFAPQGQTKIMNEGWASFWHTHLMTSQGLMSDSEIIDYADVHSGTVATQPGGLNPYKIGLELFRDIEDRWNKGQFGKEWDDCTDYGVKEKWDKKLGLGRQKIFEVRKLYNDVNFIDTFLTEDFCRRQKLFTFAFNNRSQQFEIATREFDNVKQKLLSQLTNFGQPIIEVLDANHQNRGELLLSHRFDGRELRPDYSEQVLKNITLIWGRPVWIETVVENKLYHLGYDGKELLKKEIAPIG